MQISKHYADVHNIFSSVKVIRTSNHYLYLHNAVYSDHYADLHNIFRSVKLMRISNQYSDLHTIFISVKLCVSVNVMWIC